MKIIITLFLIIGLINSSILHSQDEKFTLDKEHTALIIIDIQYFYFPGGSLPLFEPEKASKNASKVLRIFRDNKMQVIHMRHNAKSGVGIYPDVLPLNGEKVISKDEANSFSGTDLLTFLKENKIENLVILGMQTHMCVEAATRAGYDLGFNCTVIGDACTTRDLKYGDEIVSAKEVHYSTLSSLSGYYARIASTEEIIQLFEGL